MSRQLVHNVARLLLQLLNLLFFLIADGMRVDAAIIGPMDITNKVEDGLYIII